MRTKLRSAVKFMLILSFFALCVKWAQWGREVLLSDSTRIPSIILDAGHGGEDGGAVSPNGVKESGLNLEITLRLEQVLALLGQPPVLLRREDVSLHDMNCVTLREKKISDLKHRKAAVSALPGATLVSIHQNSYPDPKYGGAQVFYAPTGGSLELAKAVQKSLRNLQPDNTRQEKPISDSVYLLNHIENRAILIECGFLTNPEDEANLRQANHQRKLSLVLATALHQATEQ